MKTKYLAIIAVLIIVIIIGGLFAYISMQNPSTNASVALNASGATFPQPFLNATINAYSSIKPNVQINYQPVGSGAGINALTAKTVDFAASDAPLSANQTSQLSSPAVLHIPETIGAVTLAYNLPGVSGGLKLTGDVIARIYLVPLPSWNDASIAALNPDVTLPSHAITTVHRSEPSGTTNVFTSYLSLTSPSWNTQYWSRYFCSMANGGWCNKETQVLPSTVNTTQYTIGYVELAYALQNGMTVCISSESIWKLHCSYACFYNFCCSCWRFRWFAFW